MRRTVSAVVIRRGKLLVVTNGAGYWTLPGGKIEAGETNTQALEREVEEELGCKVAAPGRLPFGSVVGISPRSKTPTQTFLYVVRLEGRPRASAEIKRIKWTKKPEKLGLSEISAQAVHDLRDHGLL